MDARLRRLLRQHELELELYGVMDNVEFREDIERLPFEHLPGRRRSHDEARAAAAPESDRRLVDEEVMSPLEELRHQQMLARERRRNQREARAALD